jgi:hypothetical protein
MGQAKLRAKEITALKAKLKSNKLAGAYWGYRAGNPKDGFEFSDYHLIKNGLSRDVALKIVSNIKTAVDFQLEGLTNNDQSVLEGLTVAEFIDQEQDRLENVIAHFKSVDYRPTMEKYLEWAMIACCAISTLVAYGRIEQSEFNGDSFAYMR